MIFKWKTIAIVFIILFFVVLILFIGETTWLVMTMLDVDEETENDLTCRYRTCPKYNSFAYRFDFEDRTCNCYDQNNTLIYSEIMKKKE